jgi:hypothetical protein
VRGFEAQDFVLRASTSVGACLGTLVEVLRSDEGAERQRRWRPSVVAPGFEAQDFVLRASTSVGACLGSLVEVLRSDEGAERQRRWRPSVVAPGFEAQDFVLRTSTSVGACVGTLVEVLRSDEGAEEPRNPVSGGAALIGAVCRRTGFRGSLRSHLNQREETAGL